MSKPRSAKALAQRAAQNQTARVAGLRPIPPEMLSRMIGQTIHLSWARKGARWKLVRVEGDTLHLVTPKTGRATTARASEACYLRGMEICRHGHDPVTQGRCPQCNED
jgi:hypothetical protein